MCQPHGGTKKVKESQETDPGRLDSTGSQIQGNHDVLILLTFLFLTVKNFDVGFFCFFFGASFTHSPGVGQAKLSLYHAVSPLPLITGD